MYWRIIHSLYHIFIAIHDSKYSTNHVLLASTYTAKQLQTMYYYLIEIWNYNLIMWLLTHSLCLQPFSPIQSSIIQNEGHNIFKHLTSQEYKTVLRDIRHAILATDLAQFFGNKDRLKKIVETDSFDWENQDHRYLWRRDNKLILYEILLIRFW